MKDDPDPAHAHLDHDPARGQALVALFPQEDQAKWLYQLGEAEIGRGDVAGALSTIAPLAAVPDPIRFAYLLQERVAPVMAALGQKAQAALLVAALHDAKVTALVAARLQ